MNIPETIVTKLCSGRFILTVAVAIVYGKLCWSNPEFALQTKDILMVVIVSYFQRSDRNNGAAHLTNGK